MSEKKPVKRGVLSGLMGMFGDEEVAGQAIESAPVAAADAVSALSDQSPPVGQNSDENRGPSPRPSDVVREAYEPGWYRISAAMAARGDDDEHEDQPTPAEPLA